MGYETNLERKTYQKCDNCIFNANCFVQEVQRLAEMAGEGNTCLMYQDERDLPAIKRTARYVEVADFPDYTIRLRKPR
jgi:hypothetical protein